MNIELDKDCERIINNAIRDGYATRKVEVLRQALLIYKDSLITNKN